MDTSNNRLVSEEYFRGKAAEEQERFTPVPPELEPEALRLLDGRPEVTVPKNSQSSVAKWAAEQRNAKRKMQKASKRRNRG